jgi:putative membrane protein
MERFLSDHDQGQLDKRITEVESRTKTQIVLAVIKRSDNYAELPWKAFALGISIAGLLVFIRDLLFRSWTSSSAAPIAIAITLAAGAVFALLTVFLPGFARLFLSTHRAEVEVRQYAETIFLKKELFATSRRTGILLLVSLFERQVVLLPDRGLDDRLSKDAMEDVIALMTPLLKQGKIGRALEEGLDRLGWIFDATTPGGPAGDTDKNELSDEIIQEKGA